MRTTEQRLVCLERSVRLWRGVTVVLVLALVAGATVQELLEKAIKGG